MSIDEKNFHQQTNEYLKSHNIENLFEEMLQELSIHQPNDPVQFLIDLLDSTHDKKLKIMIIGKPLCGKQTLAKMLQEKYGVEYIRTQDLIKSEIAENTEFGKEASPFVQKNELLPGNLITKLLQRQIVSKMKSGWVISGYPQSKNQAYAMQEAGLFPAIVFLINVSDETVLKRANEAEKEKILKKLQRYHENLSDVEEVLKHSIKKLDGETPLEHIFSQMCRFIDGYKEQVRNVIVLGTPCSGKTTQSKLIAEHFGLVHVNVKELAYRKSSTDKSTGEKKDILTLLINKLKEPEVMKKGYVLDGFPESREEAEVLLKNGIYPDLVIHNEIPENEISIRSQGRRIDLTSGNIYHVKFNPPKEDAKIVILKEDSEFEILQKRVVDYNNNIEELLKFYKESKKINAKDSLQKITLNTINTIYGEELGGKIFSSTKYGVVKKIFVLGHPLSGKTTQCKALCDEFNLILVDPWEVVNENLKNKTKLGELAKNYHQSGITIPDEIMAKMIANRLRKEDCLKRGWVLDGFPMNQHQANLLLNDFICPTNIILLDGASKETLLERAKETHGDKFSKTSFMNQSFIYETNKNLIIQTYKKVSSIFSIKANQMHEKMTQDIISLLNGVTLGPPAAGKGTQCEMIAKKFGVIHLSTGDILRAAIRSESELGKKVKPYVENALLVPDDLMLNVISERLNQEDCLKNGWLLDGFPRTLSQAQFMVKQRLIPDFVISLRVPDEVVLERITGRRIDPVTQNVYHVVYNPPPDDIKDRCIQRADDTKEKMLVRLKAYHDSIGSIEKTFYSSIFEVDGNDDKLAIGEKIEKKINQWYEQFL